MRREILGDALRALLPDQIDHARLFSWSGESLRENYVSAELFENSDGRLLPDPISGQRIPALLSTAVPVQELSNPSQPSALLRQRAVRRAKLGLYANDSLARHAKDDVRFGRNLQPF